MPRDEHAHLHAGPTYAQAMQPSDQNQTFKAPINQIQICPQLQQPLVSLQSGHLLLGWHLTLLSSRWRTGRTRAQRGTHPHQGPEQGGGSSPAGWAQTTRPPDWGQSPAGPVGEDASQLSSKNQDPQCRPGSRREQCIHWVPGGPRGHTWPPTAPETLVAVVCTEAGSPGLLLWDSSPAVHGLEGTADHLCPPHSYVRASGCLSPPPLGWAGRAPA